MVGSPPFKLDELMASHKTLLTPEQLAENFADLHPPYSRDEAVAEASRCLYCYDAPCTRACPTDIDVPRFIRQILHDDDAGAAETIFAENIFGGSCARACPTEVLCEGACVDQTLLKSPIQIGRLQRYATDHAMERELRFFSPGPDTGKRVAVIGAGPSGLSCAAELRKMGHHVTVFEGRDVPGGLNTLGIAAYKISTDFALRELEHILDLGIDLRLSSPISATQLPQLQREYDAVFIGIGLGSTSSLHIPGEDLDGVWEALDFIFQTHTGPLHECKVGRNVVVIGAGNTAVDVATEAVRLGAEQVTIAYRRTAAEMPAFQYEYDLAKSDGVRFVWDVQPLAFRGTDGRLSGVEFLRLNQNGKEEETRVPRIGPTDGAKRSKEEEGALILPCDMAVKALGQLPLESFLSGLTDGVVDGGRLGVDAATGATTIEGVFAGGDCTSRGAEIVDAVQEGKIAAAGINKYLSSARKTDD